MLLNSVAHFTTFNFKAVSVTQLVPKTSRTQEHCISIVWQHRHLVFVEESVYHCSNNIGLLKTKKLSLNKNIYFNNFIVVSQCTVPIVHFLVHKCDVQWCFFAISCVQNVWHHLKIPQGKVKTFRSAEWTVLP